MYSSEEKALKYLPEEKEVVQWFTFCFVIDANEKVVLQGNPEEGLEGKLKNFLLKNKFGKN